jgi:hypothetical protein
MLADDAEMYAYYEEVKDFPFIPGVQGEGLSDEQYMEMLVDQTVKILSNEPADFSANAFFLPDFLAPRFDTLWTPERYGRVLDVMEKNGIWFPSMSTRSSRPTILYNHFE